MSIKLMSLIWDIEFPTQSQLLIALKLADFANDDGGSVYPSRDRIARNAQCSETTVKVVLRAFRNIGLLHVVREGGKGPKSTTEYAWNLELIHDLVTGSAALVGGSEDLEIMRAEKGADSAPSDELRGRTEPLRGRPDGAKGAASRPQPINNHHLDSSTHASAPATQSAARSVREVTSSMPALLVRRADASWAPWLDRIEATQGPQARAVVEKAGKITVPARWPAENVPTPVIPVIRDPGTGEAA